MSVKDFLKKFILAVVLFLLATYVFTFSEISRYNSNSQFFEQMAGVVPKDVMKISTSEDQATTTVNESQPYISTTQGVDKNIYSLDNFPVSHAESGVLKSVSADNTLFTLETDDHREVNIIITGITEIFRNGARTDLVAIKDDDRVTILGRKKTDDGDEFVADSIYATKIVNGDPVPVEPIELP